MPIVIAAVTFIAVVLLVLGLTSKSERAIVQERIQRQGQPDPATLGSVELELERPLRERVIAPVLTALAGIARRFTPAGALDAVEDKLETAGRPWNLEPVHFFGLKVLSIGVFFLGGAAATNLLTIQPLLKWVCFGLIVFIGFILPDYLLDRAIGERQTAIRKVLADTLDLLTVSVEAGLALDGAMQKVVEKLDNPLSAEMARALYEMRVGKLRIDALRDMAKRAKVTELSSFVAALCQADQLGVSISKVLRVQGDTLRVQRAQKARETGAKLPVKMLVPLVLFIFPALFVVILGPAIIQINRSLPF